MNRVAALSVVGSLTCSAVADITFNFDALSPGDKDAAISQYMTDLYGSSVTTEDAIAGKMGSAGIYLWTVGDLWGGYTGYDGNFDIFFNEVPITGIRFNGMLIDGDVGADFVLRAYSDGSVVETYVWPDASAVFDSGPITFSTSIDQVKFSNEGIHSLLVDNLSVVQAEAEGHLPVPAAAPLALVGLAMAAVALRRMGILTS